MSGIQTQSTRPVLHTQVSPRRMQSVTSVASPFSSLTPASRRPRLVPGLSPVSVVRILTWPLMNSSSHPTELSVDNSSLVAATDEYVGLSNRSFYVYGTNVYLYTYLTNHMTPPKPSPPIMFGDKTSTSCIIRKIVLIMAGKTLLKALQQNNTTGAMSVLLVKLWLRSIPGSNLLQPLTLIDLKQQEACAMLVVKPKSEVPKSKVPKSRPKGLGLTLKSYGPPTDPTAPPTYSTAHCSFHPPISFKHEGVLW